MEVAAAPTVSTTTVVVNTASSDSSAPIVTASSLGDWWSRNKFFALMVLTTFTSMFILLCCCVCKLYRRMTTFDVPEVIPMRTVRSTVSDGSMADTFVLPSYVNPAHEFITDQEIGRNDFVGLMRTLSQLSVGSDSMVSVDLRGGVPKDFPLVYPTTLPRRISAESRLAPMLRHQQRWGQWEDATLEAWTGTSLDRRLFSRLAGAPPMTSFLGQGEREGVSSASDSTWEDEDGENFQQVETRGEVLLVNEETFRAVQDDVIYGNQVIVDEEKVEELTLELERAKVVQTKHLEVQGVVGPIGVSDDHLDEQVTSWSARHLELGRALRAALEVRELEQGAPADEEDDLSHLGAAAPPLMRRSRSTFQIPGLDDQTVTWTLPRGPGVRAGTAARLRRRWDVFQRLQRRGVFLRAPSPSHSKVLPLG